MYEHLTFDVLLKQLLDKVPDTIDKREGSIIYDALAPVAAELAQAYINLDVILKETFADTASREYLILRAKERGLSPKAATHALGKGVFNIAVPIGSRFNIDGYNYKVIEVISEVEHSYKMECETAGADANYYIGPMTPVEYIQGLETANLTEILIPGEDEEETEVFRKRYLNSFDKQAFGGNREDYIQKVNSIHGVGGCKIYRAWNGGGTVKIVIINSEFKKPTEELVQSVQTIIDPTVNSGEGMGIAPIDHVVTVVGADELQVNITSNITYAPGWSFTECESYINEVIDKYFSELNSTWQDTENIIVRISQIEARLLDIEGILDIADTTINTQGTNLVVDKNSIVKRGVISG